MKKILILTFGFLLTFSLKCQELIIYKTTDTLNLTLEVIKPEKMHKDSSYPAMIFFFGGGWKGGTTKQFEPHAKHYSEKGIICFLAEYRVSERNNTTTFDALSDAKSAIRFLKENAKDLQIDTSKIIASGGSAGGHLAAATALIDGYNDTTDDLTISCKPNALVLFNPVLDNGPGGYGYERIDNEYKNFSPLHNIKKGAPPTIIFLGTKDKLIPVETMEYYKVVMEKVGSKCELFLYEGQGHGFFNYKYPEMYESTIKKTDIFLESLLN
jgi:acetyl esterase/lipase